MANSEQLRKLFVGGLNREANEQSLRETFAQYGTIVEVSVLRDAQQKSRGFGFVVFDDSECVDEIMKIKKEGHAIVVDGGHVEVKRALPRTERGEPRDRYTSRHSGVKKTFIGGLTPSTTTADLEAYFGKFGAVVDAMVMMDKGTNKSRGFGFVTFEDEDTADKVCALRLHEINSKQCEVRKAEPRVNYNERRYREQMPLPVNRNRFPPDQGMQQRLSNTGLDPGNLNAAVQVLNSLQTLVNAAQAQQQYPQSNQMGNMNQGYVQNPPMQTQAAAPNPAQNSNIMQLLQNALTPGAPQSSPQVNNPNASSAQVSSQLGLLLNAIGGNSANAQAGQQGLPGLLGQLGAQNTAGVVKQESVNMPGNGYPMHGSGAAIGTDGVNQSTLPSSSYYDEEYAHPQTSSAYGPVRYPSVRTETKPNAYRPY
eukprot:gene3546-4049_t